MQQIPSDLRKVLVNNTKAKAIWKNLTPLARRDFINWIKEPKQEATRKRRVGSVPSRLLSGKRRPCCYAIIPMSLYKALGEMPKAKAAWKDLTSEERRNFSEWVSNAKDSDARMQRVAKSCSLLALGKRHP